MHTDILDKKHLTRGYAIALASAAVLSTTAIFIRTLTTEYAMPPLVLAFWRDLFVVLTLLPILGIARPAWLRVERRHWIFLAGYGLVLAGFNTMWTFSVALNGAASATVLAYCSTAFTALLGRWLLKEPLDWTRAAIIALSLGGCALVANAFDPEAWQLNLMGILSGTLSGLFYALYSLMGRAASQRSLNTWTTLLYTFGSATLYLLCLNSLGMKTPAAYVAHLFWLGRQVPGWILLFLLAAGPTVLGFGLYNVSLSYLPSSVANLIVTLEPAFTAVMAYVLLDESLSVAQFGGGLMIMSSVILLRLHEEQRFKQKTTMASTKTLRNRVPSAHQ